MHTYSSSTGACRAAFDQPACSVNPNLEREERLMGVLCMEHRQSWHSFLPTWAQLAAWIALCFPKVRQLELNLAHICHTSFILLNFFLYYTAVLLFACGTSLWHHSNSLVGGPFPRVSKHCFSCSLPHWNCTAFFFSFSFFVHPVVGTFWTMFWQSCAYLKDDFSVLLFFLPA